MSYSLGAVSACSPGYVPSAAGPCVRSGQAVEQSGTPFPAGTPSGQYYERTGDETDTTDSGSPDVEYVDYTPDSGGGSSGGGSWYAPSSSGPSATSPGMIAVGAAGVLVIAYWFWTKAG